MKHIELFAGCGGLCLGLEAAGFDLEFANELSPMAAETFAYNFLREDLQKLQKPTDRRTKWLGSHFAPENMARRLREDPRTFPEDGTFCELDDDGLALSNGGLIVGNLLALNEWLARRPKIISKLREKNIDLISGGPPCQSFSLAGLREKNNEKNSLPWAFARCVDQIRPKLMLLENVTGILRPFNENGQKYYAWFEIAKTFAGLGYVPLPLHVNAKFAGVAQNRPRFILIGVRKDIFRVLDLNQTERKLFEAPVLFQMTVEKERSVTLEHLPVLDLNTGDPNVFNLVENSFLAPLCIRKTRFVSVQEAIRDLSEKETRAKSLYVQKINKLGEKLLGKQPMNANARIKASERVKRRFRLYQVLNLLEKSEAKDISSVINGKSQNIKDETWMAVFKYNFLKEDGSLGAFSSREEFVQFLLAHQTKKQIQRALISTAPAPAALSIPDDACHYSDLRTLTAREMARIQSFPDNFVFKSKFTTGGLSRRFEVPIYTQIGNAVPFLLGVALGKTVKNLLEKIGAQK